MARYRVTVTEEVTYEVTIDTADLDLEEEGIDPENNADVQAWLAEDTDRIADFLDTESDFRSVDDRSIGTVRPTR